jgi:hypothetical protein
MSRIQRGIVAIVGVVALMGPASPATASGAGAGRDLSTRAGIEQYLLSVGIDPAQAVWQVGLLNYAGPSCPGPGWNCTTATDRPIVQVALNGGTNTADCEDSANTRSKCVAVQTGSGNNVARCIQHSNMNDAIQVCTITQESGPEGGSNHAVVEQVIEQKGGSDQEADQTATVSQDSTESTGKNDTHIDQRISQATSEGTIQTQETEQTSTVDQNSDEGSNFANVAVRLVQDEKATGTGVIVQGQNAVPQGTDPCTAESSAFPPPEADQCTVVDQHAGTDPGDGGNDVQLDHVLKQTQNATSPTGFVMQTQGSDVGGQEAHLHQNGEDVSTKFADQTQTQTQSRTAATFSATQFDPMRCCNDQFDNESNVTDIDQVSRQTSPGANQFIEIDGDCETSGTCTVDQTAIQNGTPTTNHCESQSCHINIDCVEGECTPSTDVIDEG